MFTMNQGWEFALSLFALSLSSLLLFALLQFTLSPFALSLKIAHFKEGPWLIGSSRSLQKSDREQFAHFARYKRREIRWKNLFFCMFLTVLPKSKSPMSLFAHLLFFKERLEQFAPVPHKNEWFAWRTNERIHNPAMNAYWSCLDVMPTFCDTHFFSLKK